MEKGKNMIYMDYYMNENIYMGKNMDLEKNIIEMVN